MVVKVVLQQIQFLGLGNRLRAAVDTKLAIDVAGMDFDRADRKVQFMGNLGI